jgi:hypothetical protein
MKMRMLLGAVVLVAVVVAVASLLQTPTYEASALVLVDVGPPAHEAGEGQVRPVLLAAPEPEILRELAYTRAAVIDSPPWQRRPSDGRAWIWRRGCS